MDCCYWDYCTIDYGGFSKNMRYGLTELSTLSSTSCVFCTLPDKRIIKETEYHVVVRDLYPVSKFHTLVIPKRHIETCFELNENEFSELYNILNEQKDIILAEDDTVTGFNVGINNGEDAGQTIFHCHVHLIPRRKGDTPFPRGGVRGVIPDKQRAYPPPYGSPQSLYYRSE